MKFNCIAILEVSDHLPEFIDHLVKKKVGFFTKWTKSGVYFTLPHNCVWKQFEVSSEQEAENTLNKMLREIYEEAEPFSKKGFPEFKINHALSVPSKPWSSLSDIASEDPAYVDFKERYLKRKPDARDEDIKIAFDIYQAK